MELNIRHVDGCGKLAVTYTGKQANTVLGQLLMADHRDVVACGSCQEPVHLTLLAGEPAAISTR